MLRYKKDNFVDIIEEIVNLILSPKWAAVTENKSHMILLYATQDN